MNSLEDSESDVSSEEYIKDAKGCDMSNSDDTRDETDNDSDDIIDSLETNSENNGLFDYVIRNLRPHYQDISPCFVDEVPFLVDGDGLMSLVISNKNWCAELGGSSLHLIYLFEQHLNTFIKRGGKFHLIFFEYWKSIWANPTMLLYRTILIKHFTHNTPYRVHIFENCFDMRFSRLISQLNPGFFHMNLNMVKDSSLFPFKTDISYLKNAFCSQLLCILKKRLDCIDMYNLKADATIVYGFLISCQLDKIFYQIELRETQLNLKCSHEETKAPLTLNISKAEEMNSKTLLTVATACIYVNETKCREMVKMFLLYSSLVESLEVENRGCPNKILSEPGQSLDCEIKAWHKSACSALTCWPDLIGKWNEAIDVWQGTLFGHLCRFLQEEISDGKQLGDGVAAHYEMLITTLKQMDVCIEPYPISLPFSDLRFNQLPETSSELTSKKAFLRIKNDLVQEYCGDLFKDMERDELPGSSLGNGGALAESDCYHDLVVMTDEYDQIKNTIPPEPTDPILKRRHQKNLNFNIRYMNLYGSSLEGRPLVTKSIVRDDKKGSDKKTKKNSTSKKGIIIIDSNIKKKLKMKELEESKTLDDFRSKFKKASDKFESLLEEINIIMKRLQIPSSRLTAYFLKMQILLKILKRSDNFRDHSDNIDLTNDIFLTARSVLKNFPADNLTEKQKEILCKALCKLGFDDVAKMSALTADGTKGEVSDNWIRYQLQHLGPQLERVVVGREDPRADGFIPDPWQKELFDVVDRKQSALIVAPTSSGKTYASYYCMESVLREGTEGIVVYVSPTKALVNQVAATVYARFKDCKMPPGRSVYGVLTRDFKTHSMNCQILVTVPQCLEILLLSACRHDWVRRLRYVIFDEIHCIAGNLGGLSWERCLLMIRCPFLALSATIREPDKFHRWLQQAELYKQHRDQVDDCLKPATCYTVKLVIHSERHSDLVKYKYAAGRLHHMHPYTHLFPSIMNAYGGIPQHMFLSPFETLQLYDAMAAASSLPDEFNLITYFSSSSPTGFISRDTVRDFEKKLSNLLTFWYDNDSDSFERTMNRLRTDEPEQNTTRDYKAYILNTIAEFVLHLQENKMLPAIIFSYDRKLVDTMMESLTKRLINNQKVESRRNVKREDKLLKIEKKVNQRDIAKNKLDITMNKREEPWRLNILKETGNSLKGVGKVDSDDIALIERRLATVCAKNSVIVNAMQNGVCKHHAGLNNKIRTGVEMLFRMKVLNVIFATGSLALGIHMPCKTAVIAGSSPFLNSLEYHQLSGRAGRRGFDTTGNVVFFGLDDRKQHSLLTSKLPIIRGNFPLTVTMILRLMVLVSGAPEAESSSNSTKRFTISRVLTMLENYQIYQDWPKTKIQIKHFFGFTLQLLASQGLIDCAGRPKMFCKIVTHLHYHEPGNLAFAHLLHTGAIRKLCSEKISAEEIEYNLMIVLCHLFTSWPLDSAAEEREYKNSIVVLEPLPEGILESLKSYNEQIDYIYDQYFNSISKTSSSPDNTLPLSQVNVSAGNNLNREVVVDANCVQAKFLRMCRPKLICSSFAAMSGNDDKNLLENDENFILNNIKNEFYTDINYVPKFIFERKLNAYALDFYRHGIIKSISTDNGLKSGKEFDMLKDFQLILKCIETSLREMLKAPETDIVYGFFSTLLKKYEHLMSKAFPGYNI